ncbi:MAG: hypothetical protein U9R00_01075 [Patescibacteria group bacterium]|nr:hypothetical protein [Patescibacteria group bacterium]
MTKDLFDRFQKLKIKDDQFEAILRRTHILTAREELREEIGAEEIGTLFYSSISQSEHNGVHSKIDFVTLNVKAPDQKEGCGDPKILRSYLLSLTKQIPQVLSTKHLCCLSAGITKAISLKLHPKISVLSEIILDSQ